MKKISYIDMVINKKTNYDESTDAIVPDLYPDIAKIIGVTATAYIKDTSLQNDRILISGDLKGEICYIPEGQTSPVLMKVGLSFAHIEQAVSQNLTVNCTINMNKVEARIINPRKVSLLANVCIHTRAYCDADIDISEIDNSEYQVLEKEEVVNLIDSVNVSEFVISESFEYKSIVASDYDIYGTHAEIKINDTKILKNKLMIRGSVDFISTCVEEIEMSDITASIPFSQILDININDETLETFIDSSIKTCDIEHLTGAEYSFSVGVKVCITQSKAEKVPVIMDIYDVTNELLISSKKYSLLDTPKYEYEKLDLNVLIPSDNIIDKILHIECMPYTKCCENNKLESFLHVTGIYRSGKEIFDFSYEYQFLKELECTDIDFKNIDITKNSSSEINLRVTMDMYKYNNMRLNFDIIDGIDKGIPHEKAKDTIILKYISTKVGLWEIAKQYNTTIEDIIASNGLEPDVKDICEMMILIPVK